MSNAGSPSGSRKRHASTPPQDAPKSTRHKSPAPKAPAQHVIAVGHTLPFDYLIGGPFKCHPRIERNVDRNELDAFFGVTFDHMFTNYYSTSRVPALPIISRDNFITVCQFLLNGRIHKVHSTLTALRLDGYTRLPHEARVPKALSDVLAQYGRTSIHNSLVEVANISKRLLHFTKS